MAPHQQRKPKLLESSNSGVNNLLVGFLFLSLTGCAASGPYTRCTWYCSDQNSVPDSCGCMEDLMTPAKKLKP
jgi:hypothetical protein